MKTDRQRLDEVCAVLRAALPDHEVTDDSAAELVTGLTEGVAVLRAEIHALKTILSTKGYLS